MAEALSELDERTLVDRAITRDKEAYGALYDRHVVRVYRHIYYMLGNPAEAEDVRAAPRPDALSLRDADSVRPRGQGPNGTFVSRAG